MGLKLSSDVQLMFFHKVFGLTSPVSEHAKKVVAGGVKFEVLLYSLSASLGNKQLGGVTLTCGTTALLKGSVDLSVTIQNKNLIKEWVLALPVFPSETATTQSDVTLYLKGFPGASYKPNLIAFIKAIRTVTGLGLKEAKEKADLVFDGITVLVKTFPSMLEAQEAKPILTAVGGQVLFNDEALPYIKVVQPSVEFKPVDSVIDLKSAQALGQKVHGTSSGSVYHAIAIGESVKVAARLDKSGSVSLRAEWTGAPAADVEKLVQSGMQVKGQYASIHFSTGEVPLTRVVGAFLLGTGINWKAAVINAADLVIGG